MKTTVEIIPNDDDYSDLVIDPLVKDDPVLYAEWLASLQDDVNEKHKRQWAIGDKMLVKDHLFPDASVEMVAAEVGVRPSTLYGYWEMARFYDLDARAEFHGLGLSFSHMREALRLGAFEEARLFLYMCYRQRWSVARACIEIKMMTGKPLPPQTVFKGTCVFRVVNGHVEIDGLEGVVMDAGKQYDVIVRERP